MMMMMMMVMMMTCNHSNNTAQRSCLGNLGIWWTCDTDRCIKRNMREWAGTLKQAEEW